ncbi:MAG: glycine cleavage system protein GcvH [Candidatus Bipolaricaulaceae bacterium]
MIPQDLKYTEDHEWVRREDGIVRVGITNHAQQELGDIVFVELPAAGQKVAKGDQVATVESVKAVGEVFAPLAGEVVEANQALEESPDKVNRDPYGEGWIFALRPDKLDELDGLLDAAAYRELIGEGG